MTPGMKDMGLKLQGYAVSFALIIGVTPTYIHPLIWDMITN